MGLSVVKFPDAALAWGSTAPHAAAGGCCDGRRRSGYTAPRTRRRVGRAARPQVCHAPMVCVAQPCVRSVYADGSLRPFAGGSPGMKTDTQAPVLDRRRGRSGAEAWAAQCEPAATATAAMPSPSPSRPAARTNATTHHVAMKKRDGAVDAPSPVPPPRPTAPSPLPPPPPRLAPRTAPPAWRATARAPPPPPAGAPHSQTHQGGGRPPPGTAQTPSPSAPRAP